jgi:hypothetical protein
MFFRRLETYWIYFYNFQGEYDQIRYPHVQFLESNHGGCFSWDLSAKNCIPSLYSTLKWIPGVNKWCLAISQHPPQSPPSSWTYIETHLWPKLVKNVEKHVFSLFAYILIINLFSGPTISVHPYYEITHGTLYSSNPKQLLHGPLQPPIHDQKWNKKPKNRFLDFSIYRPSLHTKCILWANR